MGKKEKKLGLGEVRHSGDIPHATDEALLGLMRHECEITSKGFHVPLPMSRDKAAASEAFNELCRRESGVRKLLRLIDDFKEGKIDKYGDPVEK